MKSIAKRCITFIIACLFFTQIAFAENNNIKINEQYVKPDLEMQKKSNEKIETFMEKLNIANEKEGNMLIIQSDPTIPPSKQLSTSGYTNQPNGYTCGPTSAHNLLITLGKNVSIDTLSQELGTTQSGTSFDTSKWSNVLNSHTGSNSSWYVGMWNPSTENLWIAFVGDIVSGYPLILDTHISSSTAILPGYENDPNVNVWHYVTGVGYSGYNNTTHYIAYFDPNKFRNGAYGLHTVNVSTMQAAVSERGIIY
ncbi:C39 family peptidase [Thermoanaerobacterium thermosaccharolyticum]|uniref:Peptidase C39-like domain-containing protein n=1 Tax=Thermoanaerobacterium thermosaccharolyticum M0795 TaxID=698948 RepID=L0IHY6_THETR|nr:C39 family peptidase [Thermoanaerobacterium thermosaccharolyticum]AGB17836.1 hypothetical protein Thethe_00096 [Thermoanaerobacterium thermosaccharolyticum M0795]